ncbi:MAG TPA: FAD-dependent oxidoreductase [Rubrobacteraceae bacterium]|nr:FAD-dependent oxidoreductase [Rubrobacteraceae bacterium]
MPAAVVIGAGVVGASAAFHLAERGVETLVLDRAGPAAGSTARSGALVRAHYPTALEAELAWESLREYFEPWGERIGGGCGFTRTGFAYLVGEENTTALRHNVALGQSVGVETEVISPDDLTGIDAALRPDGLALAAFEPRGGYADPTATAVGFLRAALRHGARFEKRLVTGLLEREGAVRGVETDNGQIEAEAVVLAAGAWSVPIAESVGLSLPITPARVGVALFERPYALPTHLTVIDTTKGFYARPAAEYATLVGSRDSIRWLQRPDTPTPEPPKSFVEDVSRRLGQRLPPLAGARYRSGRSGILDMTPDGRPILGPEGPEGLYLAVGWSGTGFKKAPAVGAEVARWISTGASKRDELATYNLARFEKGALVRGEHEYATVGPH